mgnify:CR=1 FL=1
MISWIKENGGVADNVTIKHFNEMGYGLEATKDLEESELICAIPKNVMMTLDNVKVSPLKYLYENNPILKNMGNVALALFLILEHVKNENSFWHHYISSLPSDYNTVLYFDLDDFLEMKNSPTFGKRVQTMMNRLKFFITSFFYID